MKDTVDLFLDFFHSSFVTLLWIYNNNRMNLTRNINNIFNEISVLKNNKRKKYHNVQNNKTFEENYFSNLYENDFDDEVIINQCKNIYGFCLNYSHRDNKELQEIIHNYGCEHLQNIMPIILDNAIKETNDKNEPKIFISAIDLQFQIFINFLDELKDIKENGDE